MSIASIVTRGRGFGGIPALVTHGFVSAFVPPAASSTEIGWTSAARFMRVSQKEYERLSSHQSSLKNDLEKATLYIEALDNQVDELHKALMEKEPAQMTSEQIRAREKKIGFIIEKRIERENAREAAQRAAEEMIFAHKMREMKRIEEDEEEDEDIILSMLIH